MSSEEYFNEVPEAGLLVYWYPRAYKDADTAPKVGVINRGWSRGVANLSIFPDQHGAVDAVDQVYHIGDPRTRDAFGNVSPGAMRNGCWEFTPLSMHYLSCVRGECETQCETKKPRKTTAKA